MKVLYAGDAAALLGPIFVASPFNVEVKGFTTKIWGQPLIDALGSGGLEVTHMDNSQAIADFPRTVEGLSAYDALRPPPPPTGSRPSGSTPGRAEAC